MTSTARRRPAPWATCLLTFAAVCAATVLPARGAERGPVPRSYSAGAESSEARVIVKFKADSSLMRALSASGAKNMLPQQAQALSARLGLTLTDGIPIGARAQVVKASGLTSRELADRLAAQPDVEYAVVDGRVHALAVVPNDPLYPGNQSSATPVAGQWYLRAPTSTTIVDASSVLSGIDAQAAWSLTTGNPGVVVAVLDTGVRPDHPDLAGKLLPGYDFVGKVSGAADPGDYGCSTGPANSSWHGTQTAGLIGAATDNGIGMAGVGRNVMLLPVRVLGQCGGYDSDIQAAMLWATGLGPAPDGSTNPNHAKVINLSLGGPGACSASYVDAVRQLTGAGVVVVAAAGNDGKAVGTPANCPGVITVAGVRHAGTKVGYSDLGPEVALAAPAGNCVNLSGQCLFPLLTTSNSGTTTPVLGAAGATYTGGGADASVGTSFSAPLVAGTVGLMFSVNPSLTPSQVRNILTGTARSFPSTSAVSNLRACTSPTSVAQNSECYCTTTTCGAGLLDAGAAVKASRTLWVNINAAPTYPLVGSPVVLSSSASTSTGGASITSYAWEIVGGAATFTSRTDQATATLLPSAAGGVSVRLTAIDTAGRSAIASTTVSVSGAPTASIAAVPTNPIAGAAVALDGSTSESSPGGSLTISNYQWTVTAGTANASLVGATNTAKATLQTYTAGNATVSLTVTDGANQQSTTSTLITIGAASGTTPSPTPTSNSGGGGAMQLGWLLGWLASVIGVWRVTPRPRRA